MKGMHRATQAIERVEKKKVDKKKEVEVKNTGQKRLEKG